MVKVNGVKVRVKKTLYSHGKVQLEVNDGKTKRYINFFQHRVNELPLLLEGHREFIESTDDVVNLIETYIQEVKTDEYTLTVYKSINTHYDLGFLLDAPN